MDYCNLSLWLTYLQIERTYHYLLISKTNESSLILDQTVFDYIFNLSSVLIFKCTQWWTCNSRLYPRWCKIYHRYLSTTGIIVSYLLTHVKCYLCCLSSKSVQLLRHKNVIAKQNCISHILCIQIKIRKKPFTRYIGLLNLDRY